MCESESGDEVPEKPTSVDELPRTEWGAPFGTIYDDEGNPVAHRRPAPPDQLHSESIYSDEGE